MFAWVQHASYPKWRVFWKQRSCVSNPLPVRKSQPEGKATGYPTGAKFADPGKEHNEFPRGRLLLITHVIGPDNSSSHEMVQFLRDCTFPVTVADQFSQWAADASGVHRGSLFHFCF